MLKLVIVESPTKAKTINRFLGKGYKVASSMGHLIDLPKSQLGVEPETDFQVKYITIRGKGKILAELRKLAKKADHVYLATDPDREGEAISWHLLRDFNMDEDMPCRVVFNEITRTAVKKAFESPRKLNYQLVDAQQARRVLDRLVGYKISPILWHKVKKGLSAGRVQSVALSMICEREQEIDKFVPREYWSIEVEFVLGSTSVTAKLSKVRRQKPELGSEADVQKVNALLNAGEFSVQAVDSRIRQKHPAPPFTTSTLQQEAGKKLGFSARKTMTVAQQLYEGISMGKRGATGLITYMRTDSVRVSEEFQSQTLNWIQQQFGSEYAPDKPRQHATKKGAQEAHEAVRPTDIEITPEIAEDYLNREQLVLYRLIWQRYMASQMTSARFRQHTVTISGNECELKASAQELVFPGFLAVMEHAGNDSSNNLAEIAQGQKAKVKEILPQQHFTQPPPRYNESLLVRSLENNGIGRPSTYAPIIETLLQRGYAERKDGRLFATELGHMVNEQLTQFFPDILSVEFTARLEAQLDEIAEGNLAWRDVVSDFYQGFKDSVAKAEEEMEHLEVKDEVSTEVCEHCGRNMVVKAGRFGKFLACPGYPECKNTKPFFRPIDVPCPQCGADIVQLRTRRGRTFYGCKNYPDCDYRSWKQPVAEKCPQCGSLLQVEKKDLLGCSSQECDYTQKRTE